MTVGIYLLGFMGTAKVYVGQSRISIEGRFAEHCRDFYTKSCSIKMNEAYQKYGMPTCEILEICAQSELNTLEDYHINLWNAVEDGFNTLKSSTDTPVNKAFGEKHGNALYTNIQIIEVLDIIINNPTATLKECCKYTNVSYDTIRSIAKGTGHTWLATTYPEKYNSMLRLNSTRKATSNSNKIKYPQIVSPSGVLYDIDHMSNFSNMHKLDRNLLRKVLQGTALHHKGWKLQVT